MYDIKKNNSQIVEWFENYKTKGLFLEYYDNNHYLTVTTCKESATSFFSRQSGKIFICLPKRANNSYLLRQIQYLFVDLKFELVHTIDPLVQIYLIEFPKSKFSFMYVGDLICFCLKNLFGLFEQEPYTSFTYLSRFCKDPRVCRIYNKLLQNFSTHYKQGFIHKDIPISAFDNYGFASGLFTFFERVIKENKKEFKPILNSTFRNFVLPVYKKDIDNNLEKIVETICHFRNNLLRNCVYTSTDPIFEWALNGKIQFTEIAETTRKSYSFQEYGENYNIRYGDPIIVESFK